MAQWLHMSQMLQCLSDDTINSLYPPNAFPIEVRHFLAEWIERQRWYDTNAGAHARCNYAYMLFDLNVYVHVCVWCAHREELSLENREKESQARALLDQTISMLQSIGQQKASVVDRMKLTQMSRNMVSHVMFLRL